MTAKKDNSHVKEIKKVLWRMPKEKVKELDKNIRQYISISKIKDNILQFENFIQNNIDKKYISKSNRKRGRDIDEIMRYYLENDNRIEMQDSWFEILATIGSLLIMIYNIFDYNLDWNYDYVVDATIMLILLIFWIMLDKKKIFSNYKVKLVLRAINTTCTPWVFIFNLFYYLAHALIDWNKICHIYGTGILSLIVIAMIVGIVYLSSFEYRKYANKNNN